MAQKRKASAERSDPGKRHQQSAVDSDADGMYEDPMHEETYSDGEYSVSDTPSLASGDIDETPATPFSTTSARYPSELKTRRCPFDGCDKAFNRPARLQEHIRSHNNERIFKCTFQTCDKTFLRASHLNHHIKSAHTGVRDYVCDRPGCGKSFVTGSRLRRHLAAHDGRDKFTCPDCEETFRKHSTLQKHITKIHLHQKPFPCPHIDLTSGQQCQMAFETAGHLRSHQSRIHTEKRFSCAECTQDQQEQGSSMDTSENNESSVVFPTYALLQSHIRNVHPPQCPHCPIVCSTSRELRRHLDVAHGDVTLQERKVFACTVPECDRSFTKKGNLSVHIRTVHEGEKRFGCGETDLSSSSKVPGWDGIGCGKRYGSKLALEEHIRTAHLGLPNAKAERRQRLGIGKKSAGKIKQISTLAALTGHGYAEESGRHIACLYETCEHRFHRDYDLWVHMTTKHGCSEDEVQGLFMQRALLGDQNEPGGNSFGIYGLEFDQDGTSSQPFASTALPNFHHDPFPFPEPDFMKQSLFQDAAQVNDSMIPHDEIAIDPVLGYDLMEE
ncbi:hypothetical protein N7495_005023 [Penicillium taxi]|uniref:uncharacterized protein n=1 Tax=Penicillium taxi TaxID=168475 RepID=UPI002544F1FB|nr:uncharacterized protein N7495_005023 [Penicillium taxi]KAJ5893332.1 hypothetical protein N7495_005023 [Penicillium taxi]